MTIANEVITALNFAICLGSFYMAIDSSISGISGFGLIFMAFSVLNLFCGVLMLLHFR